MLISLHSTSARALNFKEPNLLLDYGWGRRQFFCAVMEQWNTSSGPEDKEANKLSQPELQLNTTQAMYV